MKYTENYNLNKPDYSDIVDIPEHFNGNMDIIDEQLKEKDTRVGPLASLITRIKTSIVNALNGLQTDFNEHKAEKVSQGVHGMGSIASQHYEEGIFTPTIIGATTAGSHTYSSQIGNYIRLGKLVHVQFVVAINAKDTNMAGSVRISGLPFINDVVGSSLLSLGSITLDSGRMLLEAVFATGASFLNVNQIGSGLPIIPLASSAIVDGSRVSGCFTYKLRG